MYQMALKPAQYTCNSPLTGGKLVKVLPYVATCIHETKIRKFTLHEQITHTCSPYPVKFFMCKYV